MKNIEIDDDLYHFIASQTKYIGESASDILRRLITTSSSASTIGSDHAGSPTASVLVSGQTEVPMEIKIALRRDCKSRVERFLHILSTLYQMQPERFADVLNIRGKSRVYFATCEEALCDAGSSTNPKQIPASGFWVVTNNNTAKKAAMLKEVYELLGYSSKQIEYLTEQFCV